MLLRRGALLLGMSLLALAHGSALAANDAAFVTQTVPAAMTVGETYTMSISMKNTASGTSWTTASGYSLVLQNSAGWSVTSLPVAAATAYNVTRPFSTTVMSPPSTPGTYTVQWCMVQNGVKFGTCSTPVSVVVSARAPNATFNSQTMTTTLAAATRAITVSMKNTGNTTWKAGQVVMGTVAPNDNMTWGINRLKLSVDVAPNASGSFTGTITSPSPGYYDMQWQLIDEKALHFGDPTNKLTVAVAGDPPTVKVESPTADMKFTSIGGYIDIPFRVIATPTGIASIKTINVMVRDADGVYSTRLSGDSGVLDATLRQSVQPTTTRIVYYVQATDTIPKSSTITAVNVDVLNDNSTFVSTNWPTTMVPGLEYDVEFVLKNNGGTTWDPQTVTLENTYASGVDTWGSFAGRLPAPVAPGENGTFKLRLTAPPAEGSYTLQARMKHSTRGPFGVGISRTVTVARQIPVVSMTAPATGLAVDIPAGQKAKVRVQGSATPGTAASIATLEVLDGTTVVGTVEGNAFNQDVELAVGTHTLKLRATDNWNEVGLSAAATVTVKGNDAAFVSQSVPATMQVGKAYTATVTMRNSGNKPWSSAAGYALGSQNPENNSVWRDNRVTSTATTAAAGQVTYSIPVTAPSKPGTYNFQWQMLQEGVEWFGTLTPNVEVVVNPLAPSVGALSLPLAGATFDATSGKAEVRVVGTVPASAGAQISKIEVLDGTTVVASNDSGSIDAVVLLATGAHTLKLRATDNFGQIVTGTATTAITVLYDGSTLVSNDLPAKMVPGVTYEGTVVFKNSGQTTWDPRTVALVPYSAAHRTAFGDASFPLSSSVAPGESASFKVKVTAPPAEGSYTFAMQLNDSTRANFGAYSSKVVAVAWVPPTVTMSSPVTGSTSDVPTQTTARVLVQGSATPGDYATISQIEVLDGTAVIETVGAASINQYVELAVGTHSLRLRATDNMGQTALSAIASHTVKGNDAAYVSQVVPATMQVGKTYTPTVTMRNAGNKPWTAAAGYALGSQNPQNNALWRDNRVTSTATVAANGQVTFSVPVTAPSKPGTYNFQWQMLQEGGEWFGPLTPNVEVVVNPLAPVVGALTLPAAGAKFTGASGKADVLVQGTVQAGDGAEIDKLEVLDGSTVVAYINYSSSIEQVVQLATGSHTLKLRATDNFGQVVTGTATTSITVLYNGATMVSRTTTTPMVSNNSYQVTVVMRNAGNTTWTAEDGYALGATPDDHTWAAEFFPVTGSIAPGQNATFTFNVFAPADPGVYPQQWQMLYQDKDYIGTGAVTEWFGAKTTVQNITVTGAPPTVTLTGPASGSVYTAANGLAAVPVTGTARAVGSATISSFEVLDGTAVKFTGSGNTMNTSVNLAPGIHTLQLRATDSRTAVATSQTSTVTVLHNDAAFSAPAVPASLFAGDPFAFALTVKNTGDTTWQPYSSQSQRGVVLAELPAGSSVWTKSGRVPLTKAVAPGESYTFNIAGTVPAEAKLYPFQWRMSDEQMELFGASSALVNISVAPAPLPVVSLAASPANQRVAPGQNAAVGLTGSASLQSGVLSKLEVFADSGSGYAATPIKTVNGNAAQLSLNDAVSLPNGSYHLKLRASDPSGHFGESPAVTINITDSPLLGQLAGVRSTTAQQLQLVGWVCRDSSPQALNYQVFVNAPPALGGLPVASGVANAGNEAGDQAVQDQCHTPGVSHYFAVDLASVQLQYPGAPVYVAATSSQGETIVLPCEDHGCRIPDGLRIGLTSPNANNLDRFRLPMPAFARAVVSGVSGELDEVSFNINGEWLQGKAEGVGVYSVSKSNLPSSVVPYAAFAKVRQGETTLITDTHWFYVDTSAVLAEITPKDGSDLALGVPIVLSTSTDQPVDIGATVRFEMALLPEVQNQARMANSVLPKSRSSGAVALAAVVADNPVAASVIDSGDAVFDGTNWVYTWAPMKGGQYSVTATLLDNNRVKTGSTPPAYIRVNVKEGQLDAKPTPVVIAPPTLGSEMAGTLPGDMGVGDRGNSIYSMALAVPPGTGGLAPSLSLNYSSDGANGVMGLGWSLNGLSTIHRCPKTIAVDGVNGRISFNSADRLCLDGQRLMRSNGADPGADAAAQDTAYWAADAQYRTEIESLKRISRLTNGGFKVENPNGTTSYYGSTAIETEQGSMIPAIGMPGDKPLVWALGSVEDRMGNYMAVDYTTDPVSGEYLAKQVRYGGNRSANQQTDLSVRFTYEPRSDAQIMYIGGVRNDMRQLLTHISTYIATDADGGNGELVRDHAIHYEASAVSGRSLIKTMTACAINPVSKGVECLPKTEFTWDDAGNFAATILPTPEFSLPKPPRAVAIENPMAASETAPSQYQGDLDGSGKTALFANRQFKCGIYGNSCNVLADNVLQIRLPGKAEFTRTLNMGAAGLNPRANLRIMPGDLDGDGRDDLVLYDQTSPGNWSYCMNIPAENGELDFDCHYGGQGEPLMVDLRHDRRQQVIFPFLDSNQSRTCRLVDKQMECVPMTLIESTPLPFMTGLHNKVTFQQSGIELSKQGNSDMIVAWKHFVPAADPKHACNSTTLPYLCSGSDISVSVAVCFNRGTALACQSVYQAIFPGDLETKNGQINVTASRSVGDLNGDGLTDFVFSVTNTEAPSSVRSNVCLSTETGVTCSADSSLNPAGESSDWFAGAGQIADFDGTGISRMFSVAGNRQICRYNANGPTCVNVDVPMIFGPSSPVFVDDSGVPAFILNSQAPNGSPQYEQPPLPYKLVKFVAPASQDKIVTVTNGDGRQESVSYARGDDAEVYSRFHSVAGLEQRPAYPQIAATPGVMVKELRRSNGHGQMAYRYRYEGLRVDAEGRGGLGFAKREVTDAQSGIVTTSLFSQSYPSVGMELSHVETSRSGARLVETTTVVDVQRFAQPSGIATVRPAVRLKTEERKDLLNIPLASIQTDYLYEDGWGNVTTQKVKKSANGLDYISTVHTDFLNDDTGWFIGLPQKIVTTQEGTDVALRARTVRYEYLSANRLVWKEIKEPDNPQYQVTTTFGRGRNLFGLINTITEEWSDPDPESTPAASRVVSDIEYDARGRFALVKKDAVGQGTGFTYFPGSGALSSSTLPNGLITTWEADGFGRATMELQPTKNVTRISRQRCNEACPTFATTAEVVEHLYDDQYTAAPTVTYRDDAGKTVRVQRWGFNGQPIFEDQDYDDLGRPFTVYAPRFDGQEPYLKVRLYYDELNRVTKNVTLDERNNQQETISEYAGLTMTTTNPKHQVRVSTSDVLGHVRSIKDAMDGLTTLGYDAFGNLSQTIDPNKNVIDVEFDLWGRRIALKDPDLGEITYKVDPVGRVWRQISNKQKVTSEFTRMVYDQLDRLVSRRESDLRSYWSFNTEGIGAGQLDEAYTMLPDGKDYRRYYVYDDKGREKTVTLRLDGGLYRTTNDYDSWGRLKLQSYSRPDSTKTSDYYYLYNQNGYLSSIAHDNLLLWQLSATDASMRSTKAWLGNRLTEVSEYEPYTDRLSSTSIDTLGGALRLKDGYLYDVLGNVATRTLNWKAGGYTEGFLYDNLNRLKQSNVGSTVTEFDYDPSGNMIFKTGLGVITYPKAGESSKPPHAIDSIGGNSFFYDANGNMERGNGRSYTWSSFDMPFTLTNSSGTTSFIYGPEHQRVIQRQPNNSKVIYAGAQEITINSKGTSIKTYWPRNLGFDTENVDASSRNMTWMHRDRLGSVVALTDANGEIVARLAYDAWGRRRGQDGISAAEQVDVEKDTRGYTGHEMLDQLELVHMNGRVYDPVVGRFLSADPLVQDPFNGQSYNRYSYVLNNPTNLTDPTGFESQDPNANDEIRRRQAEDRRAHGDSTGGCDGVGMCGTVWFNKPTAGQATAGNRADKSANSGFAACGQCRRFHGSGIDEGTGSLILDVIPGVGSAKSAGQLVTGKDLVTGEETNRAMEAGGLVLGMIPGGKLLTKGEKVAEVVVEAAKHEKQVESLAKGGENELARRGREAHKNYENTMGDSGYEFNKALPSGRRPDAINYEQRTVRELKPDSESGIRRGMRQLQGYVNELERVTGEAWKGLLDLYRR